MSSNLPDTYKNMTKNLTDGMTFALSSYWGGEPWLSKGRCPSGVTCNLQDVAFRNLVFSTTGAEPAPPAPKPIDYDYGDACATPYDDYCTGCSECDWSWPRDDPATFASKDAACRCNPAAGNPATGNTAAYNLTCGSDWDWDDSVSACKDDKNKDYCNGCDSCTFSYPCGSDWSDSCAACRCKPTSSIDQLIQQLMQ